ncbi:MAG TPA: type II CAAX endopeptidase family protein [Verrucomicrobiae bacterium]|nr:type II CAAX endopeptidase family protein [Verrucomicrobiae bacterium]
MEQVTEKQPGDPGRRVHWGPIAAVFVTVAVYFAAQICAGVFIALYPGMRGWTAAQRDQWVTNSVDAQFIAVVITEAVSVWLIWKFLKSRKSGWADIGLIRPRAQDVWTAAKGYVFYFVCFLGLSMFFERFVNAVDVGQEQQIGFGKAGNTLPELGLIFISLVILPPLVEEIICRGFLYTGLRSRLPLAIAALITSILFAAAHLQFGTGSQLLWIAAADTLVLSLVLVYVRQKAGSLWPAIYIHMFKNLAAFSVLFIFHVS